MSKAHLCILCCIIFAVCSLLVAGEDPVYSLYDFADDFKEDPLAAATNHPTEYLEYLRVHPEQAAANPAAYETVISKDVAFVNQNTEAFIKYVSSRGVVFQSIDGPLTSFTVADGLIQTATSDFSLTDLQILAANGASDFRINQRGELTYQGGMVLEETITLRGSLSKIGKDLLLTDGAFMRAGAPPIVLTGKNSARLVASSIIELTVVDNPITLPQGTLFSGSARFFDTGISLHPFAKYENREGTRMSASEELYVFHGDGIECAQISFSCIRDQPLGKKNPASKLTVFARGGATVTLITRDELYSAIVVPAITDTKSAVDLTLHKKGGSSARILFTAYGPLVQGSLRGVTTSIANTYRHEQSPKIFAWLLHQGELVAKVDSMVGSSPDIKIDGSLDEVLPYFLSKKRALLPLLLESIDLNTQEGQQNLFYILPVLGQFTKEELSLLFSRVRQEPLEKLKTLEDIPSGAARELQKELVASVGQIRQSDLSKLFFVFRNNEDMQLELLQRAGGIEKLYGGKQQRINFVTDELVSLLSKAASNRVRKLIIDTVDKSELAYYRLPSDGDPSSLTEQHKLYFFRYLKELETTDPDMRLYAIEQFDFSKGLFANTYTYGQMLRASLGLFADTPGQMRALLEKMPPRPEQDFNPQGFGTIYANDYFQEQTRDLDFANKYSVALTAQRYLGQRGAWSGNEQREAITAVMEQRKQFEQQAILDKDTYYIPITHEEERFENAEMVGLARDAGVRNIADENLKGKGAKKRFLDVVKASGGKGKTTIHFNNHGGPDHQWLSSGQAGTERSDNMRRPEAISYVELGDTLAARGKLGEVKILIDSCYSKDFTNNLYHHLEKKGVKDMPTVVTQTNRGEVGWGSVFLNALKKAHTPGTPLTGADIYKSESETFITQDLSVTMPSKKPAPFVRSVVPGIIDMGSTYDDGAALPPKKPQSPPLINAEKPTAPLPPTLIEISKNEQERDRRLAALS